MLYRDLSGYDDNTKTGTIKVHDLNYDDYLAVEASVIEEKVVSLTTYPMPEYISRKYNITTDTKTEDAGKHFCDKNHNGNVSFGECFSCLMDVCKADPDCNALCFLANMHKGACTTSMLISCAIIALIY
jgi:hypothetical protein